MKFSGGKNICMIFTVGMVIDMAKKKREHIVFDQMLKIKKSIPFSMVNKQNLNNKKKK